MMAAIRIDDKWYEPTSDYDIRQTGDGEVRIYPIQPNGLTGYYRTNRCAHCGRSDSQIMVYHSFKEAIEAGLFVEVQE